VNEFSPKTKNISVWTFARTHFVILLVVITDYRPVPLSIARTWYKKFKRLCDINRQKRPKQQTYALQRKKQLVIFL